MSLTDAEVNERSGTDAPPGDVSRSVDGRDDAGGRRAGPLTADGPPVPDGVEGGGRVAADGPSPDDGAGEAVPGPSRTATVTIVRRAVVVLVLVGLVGATIALRLDLGDRRADAREAAAVEARVADGRREAGVLADAVAAQLVQGQANADVSAADRAAQVARLADLGLTEGDMEQALDDAQEATAALEDRRDALTDQVERQAVEDAELQGCLTEVRQAVDAAFHAANREGVEVPATREICRALAGLR